jgi:hypothetical protein
VAALQTMAEMGGSSPADTRRETLSAKDRTLDSRPKSRASTRTLAWGYFEVRRTSWAVLESFSGDGFRTAAINVW